MDYTLNSSAMASPFFVPASVVDTHLKLASSNQIKVLLFFLKNISSGVSVQEIADFLKLPLSEVSDALEYWVQAGVLVSLSVLVPQEETRQTPKKKTVKSVSVKPTREEVASVASTDNRLAFLLQEAEMKLARGLRSNEMQTLAWLYMDHGMDISLILMLVEYAVTEHKATVSFIENTALNWLDAGISTIAQAEEEIEKRSQQKTAWGMIESAFGLEHRMPSDKELQYAQKWIIDWHFGRDMLKEAYNRCIDRKAKISMSYINTILERWFKQGINSLEALKQNDAKPKNSTKAKKDFASYDEELVYQLLNKDD